MISRNCQLFFKNAFKVRRNFGFNTRTMTIRDGVKSALNEEIKRDKSVFVLSEQNDYGFKNRVPIVLCAPSGFSATVGVQETRNFSKWYKRFPSLKVLAPYDSEDQKDLLKAAINDENPVIFLENQRLYETPFPVTENYLEEDCILPVDIYDAKIVKEGSDVTIVAYSYGVQLALEASEQLKKENIRAEIINLRSLRPFDFETISKSVKKTHRLVIFEYGYSFCGISSEICIKVVKTGTSDYLDAPVLRVPGDERYLFNESNTLPTAANVVKTVKKSLQKNFKNERIFSTEEILRKIENRNHHSRHKRTLQRLRIFALLNIVIWGIFIVRLMYII